MDADGPAVYTHSMWLVRAGNEERFIEDWTKLAALLGSLTRRPLWNTLVRSTMNARLFYSFGPWESEDDLAAMRASSAVQDAFGDLMSLCDEVSPGAYVVVRHVV